MLDGEALSAGRQGLRRLYCAGGKERTLISYRAVLATPGARFFVSAAFIGRLPLSMLGLGTIVLVQSRTGSYGLAGAVTATLALSLAVAAPAAGRLADRLGQAPVLVASLAVHLVGLAGLVAAALSSAPRWTLFAAAVPAGAAVPQLSSMVRARWTGLVGETPALQTAYALESVLDEVVYILGPVIVTTLATQVTAAAGVGSAAVFATVGTLLFASLRATEPTPARRRRGGPQAIATPGLRVLVAVFVAVGVIIGTVEVAMVAFATERGARVMAGPLLAVLAGGSLLAGLWYGARRWCAPGRQRLLAAIAGLAGGTLLLAAARTIPQMLVAALVAGFAVSPAFIAGYALVELLVPEAVLTEGFTWLIAATGIGMAAGSSAGGLAVDIAAARAAFLVAAAAALLAASIALLGRRWLRSPLPPAGEGEAASVPTR